MADNLLSHSTSVVMGLDYNNKITARIRLSILNPTMISYLDYNPRDMSQQICVIGIQAQ